MKCTSPVPFKLKSKNRPSCDASERSYNHLYTWIASTYPTLQLSASERTEPPEKGGPERLAQSPSPVTPCFLSLCRYYRVFLTTLTNKDSPHETASEAFLRAASKTVPEHRQLRSSQLHACATREYFRMPSFQQISPGDIMCLRECHSCTGHAPISARNTPPPEQPAGDWYLIGEIARKGGTIPAVRSRDGACTVGFNSSFTELEGLQRLNTK